MSAKPDSYTAAELIDMLKMRQGGMTLALYAGEIGISVPMLSQILNGSRSVANQKVLDFLAPKGLRFEHCDNWILVKG